MNARRSGWILCFLFAAINALIFIWVNAVPIQWANEEITCHGFFWSMDGTEKASLHTGLKPQDFLKPFAPAHVEGLFRTRQVSYFVEMLSFKFWQRTGDVLLRNYSLIILHLLNVILLGCFLYSAAKLKEAAWLGMVLLLNAGAALSTLLYPFRNAKPLTMSFLLCAAFFISSSPGKFAETPLRRRMAFFTVCLLAFFTDEAAFFILPWLWVYIGVRDGLKGLWHPRMITGSFLLAAAFLILLTGFLKLAFLAGGYQQGLWRQNEAAHRLGSYLLQPQSYLDFGKAMGGYFLRRNFGHWDQTVLGIAAGMAFLGMLVLIGAKRPAKTALALGLSALGVVFFKGLCLPHDSGVHTHFMPPGTIFPTPLFFSYHHVYVEAVMFALILTFLLTGALKSRAVFVLLLALATVINFSNAVHLKNGPADALAFHNFDAPYRQAMIRDIAEVKRVITGSQGPVYLSFPSGGDPFVKSRLADTPKPNLYASMIPVRYLRFIENGQAIISLKNAEAGRPWPFPDELSNAKIFFDVLSGEQISLEALREGSHRVQMLPHVLGPETVHSEAMMIPDAAAREIIFFIKGWARYVVRMNEKQTSGDQVYGYSYQMFRVNSAEEGMAGSGMATLTVYPHAGEVSVVGPFVGR